MLAAYFDESMSHNPSDIVLVAGCVSTGEKWLAFQRAWERELRPLGITVFHATDWEQGVRGVGPLKRLKDLTERERNAKERKLRWILSEHVLLTVVQAVPDLLYRQIIVPRLQAEANIYDDSYNFCLFACLKLIRDAKLAKVLPDQIVDCVFEGRSRRHDKRLGRHYDKSVVWPTFLGHFGPKVVGAKEDPQMVPLQAADFMAFHLMRGARAYVRVHRRRATPTDEWMQKMVERKKIRGFDFIDPSDLRSYVNAVEAEEDRLARSK